MTPSMVHAIEPLTAYAVIEQDRSPLLKVLQDIGGALGSINPADPRGVRFALRGQPVAALRRTGNKLTKFLNEIDSILFKESFNKMLVSIEDLDRVIHSCSPTYRYQFIN